MGSGEPSPRRLRDLPVVVEAASRPALGSVLVVDDSPTVRLVIEHMLKPLDVRVKAAASGQEALAVLAREPPDLILCDMLLPDISGPDICRYIRESPELQDLPVILISGQDLEEMKRQATGLGVDMLLQKPLRGDTLVARITSLLGSRHFEGLPRRIGTASRYLKRLSTLPGLRGGRWRLPDGREGSLGGSIGEVLGDEPHSLWEKLAELCGGPWVGSLGMVDLEGPGGKITLVGKREGGGALFLQLQEASRLGRARYLARMFLRSLPSAAPGAKVPPFPSRDTPGKSRLDGHVSSQ